MADDIVEGKTLIDDAEAIGTVWVDIGGTAAAQEDEIFLEGSFSVGGYVTTTRDGIFYRYATDQDLSNTTIYMWFNCGVVGILETKAVQGFTFRARGPTITNYLEWDYAGSDDWPVTYYGGWFQVVIDLESTPTRTNGTPPLTSAIREVGCTFLSAAIMPRMANNVWADICYSLPDGSPGVIIEGQNGGSTPWTWADLVTELPQYSGSAIAGSAGTTVLNVPVEFFADDAADHVFTSLNETVLWDNLEFAGPDLYNITVLGAATGTADWKMGEKTGTGATATGAQGGAIIADSTGVRWNLDADIANIDSFNLYGSSLQHGDDLQLDAASTEVISTLFIDATTVDGSGAGALLGNSYIDPNTAANNSALIWNVNTNPNGIIDGSTFQKGAAAHHAIEFGTAIADAADFTLTKCNFGTDFSASENTSPTAEAGNETFVFRDTTGSITLNLVQCTGNFGFYSAGVAVTIVADPITTLVTITDNNTAPLLGARVILEASSAAGDLPYLETPVSITRSGTTATADHTGHGIPDGKKVVIRGATDTLYNGVFVISVTDVDTYDYTMNGTPAASPATGTITASGVILEGITDSSGQISDSRTITLAQPVTGRVSKGTATPIFKDSPLNGEVSATDGVTFSTQLILDE
jgi:hypothetical protein